MFAQFRGIRRLFGKQDKANYLKALAIMKLPVDRPVTVEEVKKQFSSMSKIMHPDVCTKPNAVEEYAEVQMAYRLLLSKLKSDGGDDEDGFFKYRPDPKQEPSKEEMQKDFIMAKMGLKSEEEYLYYIIFGKTYEEDPEAFFLAENAQKRKSYIEQIEKIRKQKVDINHFRPSDHERIFKESSAKSESSGLGLILGLGLGVAAVIGISMQMHNSSTTTISSNPSAPKLTNEILEKVTENTRQQVFDKHVAKLQKLKESLPKNLKKFPLKTPPADDILLDYTIWKDIKAYTTFRSLLTPEMRKKICSGEMQVPRSQIDDHSITNYATIALEAERVLKNVYVEL